MGGRRLAAAEVRGWVGWSGGGGRAARARPQLAAALSQAAAASDAVWSDRDTTPSAIEKALRNLLAERHAEDDAFVPARVCNLIAIVDRDWRGEVENRLEKVGRFHPSRTIVCAVEKNHKGIDALVALGTDGTA